jgi:chromosome segregation ATPase
MPNLSFRWKARPDVSQLEQTIDRLQTELIRLRREVGDKEQYINRLTFLCHERMTRIDDQRGRIEQLQQRNQQLDQECESLVALVRSS